MAVSTMPNPNPSLLEVGTIVPFGGATIPSKWLACDGTLVGRSSYSDLFDALGTIWGGGDGSTTFALPNLNGRTIIGVGESSATGHTAHTAGQLAGEETHVLSVAELASHTHRQTYANYGGSGPYPTAGNYAGNGVWAGNCPTQSAGSNYAHNNMPPYAACTYIIYTGVE